MTSQPHEDEREGHSRTRRLAILVAAILVFATGFVLKITRQPDPGPGPNSSEQEVVAIPRLVDLGSDKCIPCKKMVPILADLSEEYRGALIIEFIDVWKDPDAGRPYGIRVIPTQVFFEADGAERFRHEGFMAKNAILAKWKELGIELRTGPADREP